MATSSASASSTKAIIILTIVGLLVFTLPTVLVLITGMIPSFIAYATDRRKEKYKTLTLTDQTEFKHYIQKVQDYLILHEKSRIEDVTGFPPP